MNTFLNNVTNTIALAETITFLKNGNQDQIDGKVTKDEFQRALDVAVCLKNYKTCAAGHIKKDAGKTADALILLMQGTQAENLRAAARAAEAPQELGINLDSAKSVAPSFKNTVTTGEGEKKYNDLASKTVDKK
jgi:hypothetical protein